MFELVQCWSKECAAGVGGRDVVVVSHRFPNIQTIHMLAEQDYRLVTTCSKYFPKTRIPVSGRPGLLFNIFQHFIFMF